MERQVEFEEHRGLPPTPEQVRQIAALDDPVVRNLGITQCYHELSQAMAKLTGPGGNWCSMATWASRQAGQSIRREDLMRTFERLLGRSGVARTVALEAIPHDGEAPRGVREAGAVLAEALRPTAAFKRTSDAVARGNRKVFEEIGFEFARFLAAFAGDEADDDTLIVFLDGLRPGEPPDGQRYLRDAFAHYYRALHTEDSAERAQWLLLANLEIGFHEQTRLQPEIVEAMNAPIVDPRVLRRRLLEAMFPTPDSGWREWLTNLGDRAGPLLQRRDRLADEARRVGRLAITEQMMTLWMPDGRTLRLGHDLSASFPENLAVVRLPELAALLARVDPTADSAYGTGAEDWGVLTDRMHFIADLFRVYHFTPQLFDAPFTPDQTAQIKAGRRPPGRL